jgi:cytochrome c oxidase assembly protein subunit 20
MAAPADLDAEQAVLDFEEAREKKKTGVKIFGRNVSDVPCFRESFMYGILGGVGVGLGFFLFTSRVRRAVDIAVYSYGGITVGTWSYCRYERARHNLELARFKHQIREEQLNVGVTNRNGPITSSVSTVMDEAFVISPKKTKS